MTPLFNHLWQSTLFAAAMAALSLAFRNNHARTRYALWLAASLKFLVPFSLLVSIGDMAQWRNARYLDRPRSISRRQSNPLVSPSLHQSSHTSPQRHPYPVTFQPCSSQSGWSASSRFS
jgi:hypothetical protein